MIETVFLVDDDPAVRDSLTFFLETAGLSVEAFPNADRFLEFVQPSHSGCLVLDVSMPGMSGPELQEELFARHLQLPIIFLTGQGDIPTSVRAMKNGALDFLTKPVDMKALLELIRSALQNQEALLAQQSQHNALRARLDALTSREMEILAFAIEGLSNKEIGLQLNCSHRTVEIHRSHVLEKMAAKSFLELAGLLNDASIKLHPAQHAPTQHSNH